MLTAFPKKLIGPPIGLMMDPSVCGKPRLERVSHRLQLQRGAPTPWETRDVVAVQKKTQFFVSTLLQEKKYGIIVMSQNWIQNIMTAAPVLPQPLMVNTYIHLVRMAC